MDASKVPNGVVPSLTEITSASLMSRTSFSCTAILCFPKGFRIHDTGLSQGSDVEKRIVSFLKTDKAQPQRQYVDESGVVALFSVAGVVSEMAKSKVRNYFRSLASVYGKLPMSGLGPILAFSLFFGQNYRFIRHGAWPG